MDKPEVKLPTLEELEATIHDLRDGGTITPAHAKHLEQHVVEQMDQSKYVLKNLAGHLTIGVVFAFDVVPLPFGTIARVTWVAVARILETLRGNVERARVHSLGVFLIAVIPWFGYAAYLLPLREHSRELAFVLANHSWMDRTGDTYESFILSKPKPIAKFARWLVPLPWSN
ncbi:MAG: hypothetical protein P8J17_06800 [Halioglobus sp.]|jgi:hypothetical protein|nr:hypothetical protein [Halioglobus sp.]